MEKTKVHQATLPHPHLWQILASAAKGVGKIWVGRKNGKIPRFSVFIMFSYPFFIFSPNRIYIVFRGVDFWMGNLLTPICPSLFSGRRICIHGKFLFFFVYNCPVNPRFFIPGIFHDFLDFSLDF